MPKKKPATPAPAPPTELLSIIPMAKIVKGGAKGMPILVDSKTDIAAWARQHAQELLDEGYAYIIVRPYRPTRVVGDKRRGR